MPTVFIHLDLDLEGMFNAIMQHLDDKYHRFPTNFQDFTISEEQEAMCRDMNVYASHVESDCSPDAPPVGKQVF